MSNRDTEERLERIEEMLEELGSKQQEVIDVVQAHFEGLGETVRNAQVSMDQAVMQIEEAVEDLGVRGAGSTSHEAEEQGRVVDEEERFEQVKAFVVEKGKASTSLLQRRFKVGYGLAARLMDRLEEEGVIAPSDGTNRMRKVINDTNV